MIWTTEKPKNDEELDDKVFLTENQMATKLLNWDFIYANWITNIESYGKEDI